MTQPSISFLSVASLSHTHQALVALQSVRASAAQLNADYSYFLFISDLDSESLQRTKTYLLESHPWIKVLGGDDLGSGKEKFHQCFRYYDRFEMSNVAKYLAVECALKQATCGQYLVFMDADLFFLKDARDEILKCGDHALLLSSHFLGPATIDEEHDVMVHGLINSGFSVFNRSAKKTSEILQWIIDRVFQRGFAATQLGMFVDQLWMSALPILEPESVVIAKPVALNIAYWNLRQRKVELENGTWMIEGVPLLMFHFSGFDESKPNQLSKHAHVKMDSESGLEKLCKLYSEKLIESKSKFILSSLPVLKCTQQSLLRRMEASAPIQHGNLFKTRIKPGDFERLGALVDKCLRKIFPKSDVSA